LSSITDPVVKNNISIINEKPCCICPLAKFHRLPFSYSTHHASQPFEIVHCDLWGPCSIPSYDGFKYFLTLVDCFTRSTWLYLLPTKADTKCNIESFANLVENQFNCKIKILRSDNKGEFNMKDFFHIKGIIHQTSCVETPQQNGIVERKHQHLLNVARALRFQAKLPLQY
jgi:transposase InsO family protein